MPSERGPPRGSSRPGRSSEGDACGAWTNADCAGTPHCPPRCPRFFDRTGAPMLVRFPDEAEWEQLLAMYGDIEARSLGLPPVTRERRRDWLATLRETGWNLAAFDGERPVGHIAVAPADDPVPKFVVFVRDEYHGRGIGTELVKQAIAYAADRDHVALELTVESENRRAISVYTNVGFEVVSRGVDYRMELSLEDPAAETVQLPPGDRPSDG